LCFNCNETRHHSRECWKLSTRDWSQGN
jgi:hypothetical protein